MIKRTDIYIGRAYFSQYTMSRVFIPGQVELFGLEPPWLGNHSDSQKPSCFPEGRYAAYVRESEKNGTVIELKGVEARTAIQIHIGNFTRDTEGCVLVGKMLTHIDSDMIVDVGQSTNAMRELLEAVKDSDLIMVHVFGAERPKGIYA